MLRTINGGALPVTVLTRADFQLDITAETLYVKPDGVFTDVTHYRRTNIGVIELTIEGSGLSFIYSK